MRATLKAPPHQDSQTIVLASNNAGKLAEFERLFASLNVCIEPQKKFNISQAAEPFNTFVENALAKARHASAQTGLPAIADDSGICVDALNGRLGFYLHAMPLLSWLIIRSIPQCEPNYSIWMQMRPIIRCYYIKCRVSNNDALVLSLHWYTSDTPMTHCH